MLCLVLVYISFTVDIFSSFIYTHVTINSRSYVYEDFAKVAIYSKQRNFHGKKLEELINMITFVANNLLNKKT